MATTMPIWGSGSLALATRSDALWARSGTHGGGALSLGDGWQRPVASVVGAGAGDGGQWWLRRVIVLRAWQGKLSSMHGPVRGGGGRCSCV